MTVTMTAHRLFSNLLLLSFASVAAAAPDAKSLTPLPAEARAALDAVELDPKPPELTRNIHYVVSDEVRHDLFAPHMKDLGGVFLGVGTNQNFLMAGLAKPDILVLLDFDEMVTDLHRVYRIVFLNAKTPDEFMSFWVKDSMYEPLRELIGAAYPDKPLKGRVLEALRYSRYRVRKKLQDLNRLWQELGFAHFLNDQAQYDYIRALFESDRVHIIRGDLTKDKAMVQLAAVFKRFGWVLRVYHPSNAEQYFPYDKQYRVNCDVMPTDEKSVVVRTRAWRKPLKEGEVGTGEDGQGEVYYTYVVQKYSNFRLWLAERRTTNVRTMLPWKTLKKDDVYVLEDLPPEPKKAD